MKRMAKKAPKTKGSVLVELQKKLLVLRKEVDLLLRERDERIAALAPEKVEQQP